MHNHAHTHTHTRTHTDTHKAKIRHIHDPRVFPEGEKTNERVTCNTIHDCT